MSNTPYKKFSTRETPQTEPIPDSGQVENNAGGFGWAVDKWTRLDRFLILGSEGGTYYVGEQKLTKRNALSVIECIKEDGIRVVNRVVEISEGGRAPKNDPALFVLAMCSGLGDLKTKKLAFSVLPKVARIGTHLFHFVEYVKQFRGRGKLFKNGITQWYLERPPQSLAYQVAKYQSRDGWSHRDILRLVKPVTKDPEINDILGWVVGKNTEPQNELLSAYVQAQTCKASTEVAKLIRAHGLTREMIPTHFLSSTSVWEALLEKMPLGAMIRNLGKMTNIGLLAPMSDATSTVIERITDESLLTRARIHPLGVLVALKAYENPHSTTRKSSMTWNPISQIVDALNDAFYASFGNVTPTNKRTMLALDVSGSMEWNEIAGMTGITPRVGSAAMAMVTAKVEPKWSVMAFSHELVPVSFSPRQRLDDIIRTVSNIRMGGTDCALPMTYALENKIPVDAFYVYTDSETWAGRTLHPKQALDKYRQRMGINAKLVVIGMVSNGFTIADPRDRGMLDVVGFDTATPNIMSDFVLS
jgi:60 kDa SS-A/Ro ribonucleoprotein